MGVSVERALAAHRWLAVAFLVAGIAHGFQLVHERGRGVLRDAERPGGEALFPPGLLGLGFRDHLPTGAAPAFGTAALACVAATCVLASNPVRRRYFEVFKASHVVLFPWTVLLAVAHAPVGVAPYLLPGLALWVFDRAARVALRLLTHKAEAVALPNGATSLTVRHTTPLLLLPAIPPCSVCLL